MLRFFSFFKKKVRKRKIIVIKIRFQSFLRDL